DLRTEDDAYRRLRPGDGDAARGPREVDIGAQVLRAHGDVGAAVGLAQDQRDLRHRGLGVGVNELGAVRDDAAVLLRRARQVTGDVDEAEDRDVEAIAEPHEARRLARR